MSEVFVLGAGFSRAISDEMPLLADLGRSLDGQLSGRPELARYQRMLARFGGDVEFYLSYLSEKCPWQKETEALHQRARFLEAQGYIAETIRNSESKAFDQAIPEWLFTLIEYWRQQQSTVITLNYDTSVERLSKAPLPLLYRAPLHHVRARTGAGLYGSDPVDTFRLLKLHGSVNWFYSGSLDFPGEQVYYAGVDPQGDDDEEYLHADLVPFIVPPVAAKSPFFANLILQSIWRAAATALRRARVVYFLGYSMPVTDLTMRLFLASSVPEERVDIHIVNLASDDAVRERYQTALPQSAASCTIR